MADRILKNDVRQAFASFRQTAERLGFNTRSWALQEPDIGQPWSLVSVEYSATENTDGRARAQSIGQTEFPSYVGNTNRTAYEKLTSWSQAMYAVEILRKNGSS